jgi:hypothetical protein
MSSQSRGKEAVMSHVKSERVFASAPASGTAPTQHKIFVGGLSQSSTKESMERYFSNFGYCECVVMIDKESGRSRGFGFASFEDQDSVMEVLAATGHEVDGKAVECKACEEAGATPRSQVGRRDHADVSASHYEAERIFVGGLPQSVDSQVLGDHFAQFGYVVEAKVHIDSKTQRSKGFGYVSFDESRSVELALASGRNIIIDGKHVEVKRCEAKNKGMAFHPPAPLLDVGIPIAPGSPAAEAVRLLTQEQARQIRSMVPLLQDHTTCSVIQCLIDELYPAEYQATPAPMARGQRYSPY